MDVVLQSRPPEYGSGRFHPKAASGQGCITVLLLGPVEIGGITEPCVGHRRTDAHELPVPAS